MQQSAASSNRAFKAKALDIARKLYIVLTIVLVLALSYYLYNVMSRPVAGVLVFLGGTLAAYFYYVKWFVIAAATPSWPPYQTVCPDYLTPITPGYEVTKGDDGKDKLVPRQGGRFKCVDFIGVSTNGGLKRIDPSTLNQQIQNPQYFFEVSPNDTAQNLKARLLERGLSWVSLFGDN